MAVMRLCMFFFFKQKTAYERRISDWSSDVCSSDLFDQGAHQFACHGGEGQAQMLVAKGIDQIADAARPADRGQIIGQRRPRAHPAGEGPGERQSEFANMRSEEHTSELQSLMRISYAVFCLKKHKKEQQHIMQERNEKNKNT